MNYQGGNCHQWDCHYSALYHIPLFFSPSSHHWTCLHLPAPLFPQLLLLTCVGSCVLVAKLDTSITFFRWRCEISKITTAIESYKTGHGMAESGSERRSGRSEAHALATHLEDSAAEIGPSLWLSFGITCFLGKIVKLSN